MGNGGYDDQIQRAIREIQRANMEAVASQFAPLVRQVEELQKSLIGSELRRSMAKLQEALAAQVPNIASLVSSIYTDRTREIFAGLAKFAKTARELRERAFPPNWSEFNGDEIESIVELMQETGWSLVWVPRAEVVRKLLDAPDGSAREEVLVSAKPEILDDLDTAIAEVKHSQLAELSDHVVQAIGSFRAGFEAPAQALASAVFTTVMHVHLGLKRFPTARAEFARRDPMEVELMVFKLSAIYSTAARAIDTYWGGDDEPIPTSFNRHASTHRVSEVQYTTVNALAALLLVTSLLRELEPLLNLQFPENGGGAPSPT